MAAWEEVHRYRPGSQHPTANCTSTSTCTGIATRPGEKSTLQSTTPRPGNSGIVIPQHAPFHHPKPRHSSPSAPLSLGNRPLWLKADVVAADAMTEVVPADRTTLLQQKQKECTAIVRSRKRKIRELFAVATVEDGIPSLSLVNPDAPPTNAAESKYLDACDLSKGRRFHETSIPPRSRQRPDARRRPSTIGPSAVGQKPLVPAPTPAVNDPSRPANNAPNAYTRPGVPNTPSFPAQHPSSGVHAPSSPAPSSPAPSRPPSAQAARSPQPPATATPPTNGPRPILKSIDNQPAHPAKPIKSGWTDANHRPAPLPPPPVASPLVHHPSPAPGDVAQQAQARPSPIERPQGGTRPANDGSAQSRNTVTLPTVPTQEKKQLSLNVSPQDFRPSDALSSPGSTVQTATTPAVIDTSANTSPDYDGPPAGEKPANEPEASGPKESPSSTRERPTVPERPNSVGGISRELEAQLLRDSAEAVEAKSVRIDAPPSRETTPSHASAPVASGTASIPPSIPTADGNSGLDRKADGDTVMSEVPDAKRVIAKDIEGEETSVEAPGEGTGQATVTEQSGSLTHLNTASVPQQAERAVTRSATGTVRQKSVLEILAGDHTKASSTSRPSSSSGTQSQAPITPTSQSPRPRGRSLTDRLKSKEKSKLSTVVFGKQPRKAPDTPKTQVQSRPKSAGSIPSDDYFTPLFVQGFSNSNKWMKPLEQILHHAHKTVSTPDSYTQILDNQACKVLRRVYQLQQQDKWSLRQPKRCPEPTRPASHMDVLLKEMKWMRTDFREERKWKTAVARNLAHACAEWVALSDDPEEARLLRVNAVTPATPRKPEWDGGELTWNTTEVEMTDGTEVSGAENYPTPDLVASAEASSPAREEEPEPDDVVLGTVAPSAIFTLHDDDVVFGLHHSPNTDRLLDQLPMYGSPLKAPERDIIAPQEDPDIGWKREALPLSKYVEGRIELEESEPPRKRSRYQYTQEDDSDNEIIFSSHAEASAPLAPENPHVALFQEENKPMRDRLHAGHQFRPPNEHTMPFQSFYESRNCSQWTVNEDDELRSLVREYSYNWSLISSMLSTKSQFASGAERRTPWECFERWVMLEGLPNDMQKTQYFKLWQGRIDSAQQVIRQFNQNALAQQAQQQQAQQAQQAQQQQPGASGPGPAMHAVRKRLSLPVKVERRRNQKHMTMIDAMRKLAKKREAAIQKQQHAANSATMRKAQEQPPARVGPIKTPREYSIMRWERDQAMAERLAERMAQQQQRAAEAQRRARPAAAGAAPNNANRQTQAQQMQARLQQGQQLAAASGAQMSPNPAQLGATHPHAAVARVNGANQSQMGANGQARARVVPMQGALNGTGAQGPMSGSLAAPPLQMNGNGQMQVPVVNGQARMTINNAQQPDLATVLQAQRISEQQRQAVQLRQAQQQHPQQQQGQQPHQQNQQAQQQQQQQQQHQQHAPQSAPQQHLQQQQQGHGLQQANGLPQNSPPAGRAAVANGVNQKNYMGNATQAMIANFNASNASGGMSTPPAGLGLNMPASHSPSPRPTMTPQIHQTFLVQLQHIENQIRISHPNTPQEMVREMAKQLLQNRHQNLSQSAMNAAAGGGSGQQTIANGPHQYAQLLRAQQQAQQQQAQQAQSAQQTQQPQQLQQSQQGQQTHQAHQSQQSPQPQPQQHQQQQAQHAQHAQQTQQNGQQNGQTQRHSSAGSPTPPVSSVSK